MSGNHDYLLRRAAVDPTSGIEQPWGWLNFVSDMNTTGVDGVTVGTVRIEPGSANPLHIHGNCSEIILLLGGSVEHVVGDDLIDLSAGDLLIVPAGLPHRARCVGPGAAEMIVVYNAGERDFQLANPPGS